MKNIIYTTDAGEPSAQAISNALYIAVTKGKNVILKFNGYAIKVTPKSKAESLLDKLGKMIQKDIDQRSKIQKYIYRLLNAKWSNKPPTKSGYYWMRDDSGIPLICWYYKEDNSYSLCDAWGKRDLEGGIEFFRCNIYFPPIDKRVEKLLRKRKAAI